MSDRYGHCEERNVKVLLNYMVGKSDWLSENVDRMATVGFTGEIRSKEIDGGVAVLPALNALGK